MACQVEGPRRAEGHGVCVLFTHYSLVRGAQLGCRGNEGGGVLASFIPSRLLGTVTGRDR